MKRAPGDPWRWPATLRLTAALAWTAAVVLVTLVPIEALASPTAAHGLVLCVICGPTGAADAVLNVVLFVPLGVIVGTRHGWLAALGLGASISAGIELGQLWLPGRFSTAGDVVWNAIGAGVGAVLARRLGDWVEGQPSLGLQSSVVALPSAYLLLAGVLLQPVGAVPPYHARWTPSGGVLEHYEGRVLEAWLGEQRIPDGAFPAELDVERLPAGDWTLEARLIKGPPPPSVAPLIRVDASTDILYLAVDAEELVWHERSLAQALRFNVTYTDLRFPDALSEYGLGDTLSVAAHRAGGTSCLRIEDRQSCGSAISPRRSWTLLRGAHGLPRAWLVVIDLIWMAGLFSIVGLFGGRSTSTLALAGVAAGLVFLVTALTALATPHWLDLVGLMLGVLGGWLLRPLIRILVAENAPSRT